MGPWARVSESTAWRGVRRLLKQNMIEHVATLRGRKGQSGLRLYMRYGTNPPEEWRRRYGEATDRAEKEKQKGRMAKLEEAINGPTRRTYVSKKRHSS